jgi:hypothetical protein
MLESNESNSSSADKRTDSIQALWEKIGLAKIQDLDATHTLEVELSF